MKKNIIVLFMLFSSLYLSAQNNLPFEYQFNSENNIYKINDVNKPIKGSPQIIITYLWDTISNNWIISDSTFYTYNTKAKILSETSKTSKIFYEYNPLNLLLKTIGFKYNTINNSWDTSFRNTNNYDEYGSKILNLTEIYENGSWVINTKNKISYNYLNDETEIHIEGWDSISNSYKKSFKYYYKYYTTIDKQEIEVSYVTTSIWDNIYNQYLVKKAFVNFKWYIFTPSFITSKPKYFRMLLYNKDTSSIETNFTFDIFGNQTELKKLQYNKGFRNKYDWERDQLSYLGNYISEKIVQYFDTTQSKFINDTRFILSNHLNINTSINQNVSNKNNLSLYPNPITNFLNIESKTNKIETIQIIDLMGNLVENITVKSKQIQIDLSHLSNGIYFIQSIFENGQINNDKIIITR
jgi:hypothetical protein